MTESVPKAPESFHFLTRLSAPEHFIEFCCRESCKTYRVYFVTYTLYLPIYIASCGVHIVWSSLKYTLWTNCGRAVRCGICVKALDAWSCLDQWFPTVAGACTLFIPTIYSGTPFEICLSGWQNVPAPGGRAVGGVRLRPLTSWDCGFESHQQRREFVSCEGCLLLDRDLCDGSMMRPEEPYRVWRVSDRGTS
jgi:hypothetical protein